MVKGPFLNFGHFFFVYAIKSTFVRPILLKLAQISCIIIYISPIENEETPSNIMGKRNHFKVWLFFSCLRDKVHTFYSNLLKLAYSRTSMARTSLGPWKFVRDMGSSSH